MPLSVVVVSEDCSLQDVRKEMATLREAVGFALQLADELGRRSDGDRIGRHRTVEIRNGSVTHLTIAVLHGGLLSGGDDPE